MKNLLSPLATLLPLLLPLSSCSEKPVPSSPLEHFSRFIDLKPSKTLDFEELNILRPASLTVNSQFIALRDVNAPEGTICLIDKQTGKLSRGVFVGSGPDDVTPIATPTVRQDTIIVTDMNLQKILFVSAEDSGLVVTRRIPYKAGGSLGRSFLSGDRVLTTTFFDSLTIKLATLDGEMLSFLGYPTEGILSTYPYQLQNTIFHNTRVVTSPDEKHFSFGVTFTGMYGFGDIVDNRLILTRLINYPGIEVKIKEVKTISENYSIIMPEYSSPVNTISCFASDKYVAYLYSGGVYYDEKNKSAENTGNVILLYSWTGEPAVALRVNENLGNIAYDASRNTIIAIVETPESQYVEYSLDGILDL